MTCVGFFKKSRLAHIFLCLLPAAYPQGLSPVSPKSAPPTPPPAAAAQQTSDSGLEIVTPTVVQARRREYSEAYQDYQQHYDQNLADDLVKHPEKREELLKRIADQRDRTHKMLDAQGRYYQTVRQLYAQVYEAVAKPSVHTNNEEDKKRLSEISLGLSEQRQRLEAENAKESNPLIKCANDALIANLRKAQDANDNYQSLLDKVKQTDTDLADARTKAMAAQNEVVAVYDQLLKQNQQRAAAKESLYNSLAGVAGHIYHPTGGTKPPVGVADATPPKTEEKRPATPAEPVKPVDASPPLRTAPEMTVVPQDPKVSLQGHWTGKSNATSITMDITDTAGKVTGWLYAFDLPKKYNLTTHPEIKIAGDKLYNVRNTSYTFNLGGPNGIVEIEFVGGKFELIWHPPTGGEPIFDALIERVGDAQGH